MAAKLKIFETLEPFNLKSFLIDTRKIIVSTSEIEEGLFSFCAF